MTMTTTTIPDLLDQAIANAARLDAQTVEQFREQHLALNDHPAEREALPPYDDLDGWKREQNAERSTAHAIIERVRSRRATGR
jgi:hypothetical protein